MNDMVVDFDTYEEGKQYCLFDSDLLRFKPDYSKLSIADFDDYTRIAWILRSAGGRHGGVIGKYYNMQFNRIDRTFHLCAYTTMPTTYNKRRDFYEETKNSRYFENVFSLLNIKYKLISLDAAKKINNEYNDDVGMAGGRLWWKNTEEALFSIIEYVETMGNIDTKMYFGTDKTRRHYYGIMTSLSPWSVFLNSGLFG